MNELNETDFIARAAALTARLRALDPRRVVFGAAKHRHEFARALSPAQIASWERAHNLELPVDYRRFLSELGNGGAGPYYGVQPLPREAPQLQSAFPYAESVELNEQDDANSYWESPLSGAITIADYGCGSEFLLVLRGQSAGQVWFDARYETGLWRVHDSFDEWWLELMQPPLQRFERVLSLMRDATPHEEIHRQLEPGVLQLDIDNMMLSLMNINPETKPRVYANKPWGKQCGLVEENYEHWLRANVRR